MPRLVILFASIASVGLSALDANAWMDEWAPPFESSPADFRELSHDYVTNFVSTLRDMDGSYYYPNSWDRIEHSEGAAIDLNGDGVDDYVFLVPGLGSGLAGWLYWAHFIVSDEAGGQKENVVECYGAKLSDLVRAGGKTYFRLSDYCFVDFEKSKHNHWVYQLFSFAKDGVMRPANGDFGKLFPAVTIYYYNPKFKQIMLTKKDLKEIEDSTVVVTRPIGQVATECKKAFDLLNYRYLWNTDAEKAKMVVNPTSRKKEADGWKPPRKLTPDECTKMMRILTKRFGEPAKCRLGYASFAYVWRFEGDEWLSIGVVTRGNTGGDPIAISHWEWRKPELSVYSEEEAKIRQFPIVQIDKEGLPPAAFFGFFNPYPSIKDGETEKNFVTEFNATKYMEESPYATRCTAEWDADESNYQVYTAHPDEWRGEFNRCKGAPGSGHTNEYHVGSVRFYKIATNLFMCDSMFSQDGTIGPARVRYLFETYEREVWSVDSDRPVKSKLVRYLGAVPIDEIPKFREEWMRKRGGLKVGSNNP